jgi:ketosteroid isomerase-like protein
LSTRDWNGKFREPPPISLSSKELAMRLTAAVSSIPIILLAGCATPPSVDLEAERTALMDADRAWYEAYAASADRPGTFVSKVAADAVLLPPDAPIAEGRDAIHAVIAGLEATPGFSVTWTPVAADVGSGGDLGYTRGTYRISFDGPAGAINIVGKYLTLWKKQADGAWMVVVDMFNADAAMAPPM